MRAIFHVQSRKREELIDITAEVAQIVRASGIANGIVSVYSQGATAAIMIGPIHTTSDSSDMAIY